MKLKIRKWCVVLFIFGIAVVCWTSGCVNKSVPGDRKLVFDPGTYTEKTLTLDGTQIPYRAYEGIVYVSNPVDRQYQNMNFYVPSEYFENQSVSAYTLNTVPIFFPNSVGGYMPGIAGSPGPGRDNRPNSIAQALAKGYIVAAPGARGRTLKNEKGLYTGKAPACIVDLKAAVRYLRYNDSIMPGDAEKIISNGTSAGGALSSLLGATGNNADYEPYLQAIGAADTRDDIFAASCYCPITNLDNADTAYEWLFNGLNTYNAWGRAGTLTADQVEISGRLKALFPQYLNGLGLQRPNGTALTLDANGLGTFRDYVKSFVIASAQKALNSGTDLGKLNWITIKNRSVTDIDFGKFIEYATRMKSVPPFDALDLSSPENNLFGNETTDNQHFTQFGMKTGMDNSMADATVVKMMNPMPYIGSEGTMTARYWRIRHGVVDRDTSLAVPVILATRLQNNGCSVDFALPWGQGHGGDYDLDELFAWIDKVCR